LFHCRGAAIEPQFCDEFLRRGENFLSPEKPGAAGVAAPGLDNQKKMVLITNLTFWAAAVIIFATKLNLESPI
jgi:hypothetical protein